MIASRPLNAPPMAILRLAPARSDTDNLMRPLILKSSFCFRPGALHLKKADKRSARAIPVLMYHHVSRAPGLVTVSPETFEAQIRQLAENGHQSICCDDLLAFMQGTKPLAEKSLLITFDDGFLDNYVYAHPILKRYGMSATLFVVTRWLGEGAPRNTVDASSPPSCPDHNTCKQAITTGRPDDVILRWSEAEVMRQAGTFEFHSHTHTHTRWDKDDFPNRLGHIEEELSLSRDLLAHRLGINSRHLCWPQGYHEPDYVRIAQKQGYEALYTTEKRVNTQGSDPLRIGRLVVKDRADRWLNSRVKIYSNPLWGNLYTRLRGE